MSNYDKNNNPNFLSQLAEMMRANGNPIRTPDFNPNAAPQAGSGTYSPYSTPEEIAAMSKSYDGQDNGIASQRALANAMRSKAMPQGKTIGSGKWQSYQAPNWGENLAGATEKIVGGYMAGQANKQDALLDEEKSKAIGLTLSREEAKEAYELKIAAEKVKQEQLNKDRTYKQTGDIAKAGDINSLAVADKNIAGRTEAARVAAGLSDWANFPVKFPDGTTGQVSYNATNNTYTYADGTPIPAEVANKMVKFSTVTPAIPASVIKEENETNKTLWNGEKILEDLQKLTDEGFNASGIEGTLVNAMPDFLKNYAEAALFNDQELIQRSKAVYFDAQVKEAISTGVLSDQDVRRLEGLNIAAGGLTPNQQMIRLATVMQLMRAAPLTGMKDGKVVTREPFEGMNPNAEGYVAFEPRIPKMLTEEEFKQLEASGVTP